MSKKLTIEEMRGIAKSRGGICLSKKYINTSIKLKWQCKKRHIWEATPSNIIRGTWCPKCGGSEKLTIEEMKQIAKKNGGKCLSNKYINAQTKLKWQCEKRHIWEATPNDIKNGTWCRKCAGCEKSTIKKMQQIAKKNGGKCLSNEYINAHTKLKWQCEFGHVWVTMPLNIKKGTWCPKCSHKIAGEKRKLTIEDMKLIARKRGGECLSNKYINAHTKLKWKCRKGYIWEASPTSIRGGTWCPECGGRKIVTINDVKEMALERGGICLSKDYINANTKLKWRCNEGHIWRAAYHDIQQGSWCPST